jgi:hypothetical protein
MVCLLGYHEPPLPEHVSPHIRPNWTAVAVLEFTEEGTLAEHLWTPVADKEHSTLFRPHPEPKVPLCVFFH